VNIICKRAQWSAKAEFETTSTCMFDWLVCLLMTTDFFIMIVCFSLSVVSELVYWTLIAIRLDRLHMVNKMKILLMLILMQTQIQLHHISENHMKT